MTASGRPSRRIVGRVVLLSALLIGTSSALAIKVDVPSAPSGTLRSGAPPAGSPQAPVTATNPTGAVGTVTAGLRTLRLGLRGDDVTDLQTELRRRGFRVSVDGAYGPATARAVRRLQKRLRMRADGIATVTLLRRVGVQSRSVASGGGVSAPVPAGVAVRTVPAASPARAATALYLKAFPVAGTTYTYTDDWGAPRGQGPHQGNDIMAPRGTPLLAVADGVVDRVTRVETGLGGLWVWLRDTKGHEYYYAHMHTIAANIQPGTRVTVGQQLGTIGNTGDARYGAPHLHFEIHPGGGGAVNPYADLRAVDPKG
jgi:murein DD-endopeptidase MepM/ murein hydrolase activator NlpD